MRARHLVRLTEAGRRRVEEESRLRNAGTRRQTMRSDTEKRKQLGFAGLPE